jgi:20S proteasome subunit beta 4
MQDAARIARLMRLARRYHNPDGTLEEGLEALRRTIDETSKRLIVAPGNYKVKIVDKDGVREVTL